MTDGNRTGIWPENFRAAVSITLDNMGEAAELGRGTWPEGSPIGTHSSVTESLPVVLDLLDEADVRVTYFIEGWNAGVYPDSIREIARRGHEIGLHGWQHEPWAGLDPATEERLLDQSVDAFAALGIHVRGFRPPGGRLTKRTLDLLAARGITRVSPAGRNAAARGELAILPFEWQGIDAFYYSDGFGSLRQIKGVSKEPMTPGELETGFMEIVNERLESGGYTALLFHSFLETTPERVDAMRRVLVRVRSDERIWCAPCGEIGDWVLRNRERFGIDPEFDETTWAR
jgi:peptidoglycan/xylan/chitin deacetylase (PgdA/CDA1 family)